jgi:leader peptidase (prepilin peptidase)/N-methyltransferase
VGFHLMGLLACFALGSVVGSFVNVCVYRIPWEKSVLWPGSHCPHCLNPIAPHDNLPILGWLLLRGRCRNCSVPISGRYPLIEALVGALFVAVYTGDVWVGADRLFDLNAYGRMGYHQLLVTLLVIATFTDFDFFVIPDAITVTGMVLGLLIGTMVPGIRPAPSHAVSHWDGLLVGLLGWAVAGGLVWGFRFVFGLIFRREAMGFGDVTLLAMIGAFTGWQLAVLTFFIAPFFGIAQALFKLGRLVLKVLRKDHVSGVDREVPFGPYLSMAALSLLLSWPWFWSNFARRWFDILKEIFT